VAEGYLERVAARTAAVGSVLCIGLDPDPADVPPTLGTGVAGIERFALLVLEAAAPSAAAVKANVAFFEAFGSAGLAALERVRAAVPAAVPFIADAKRGDVSSTAARQAVALFDALDADAVTLSPYLGRDAIAPFLERPDRFAYVLCRTSNPGAGELQDLDVGGTPLYVRVAEMVTTRWSGLGECGLVVGATYPDQLRTVRAIAGELPILVPGVGAQGGDLAASVGAGTTPDGTGLLVSSSREILYASSGEDFATAARAVALRTATAIRDAATRR